METITDADTRASRTTQGAAVLHTTTSSSRAATGNPTATSLPGRPAAPTPAGLAPVASARRLKQPSWRDVRLVVGVLLVLGSVVAGALVVSAADRTTPTYAAAHALTPGESLDAADLVVVGVRLTGTDNRYLVAASGVPAGAVLLRAVQAGELVPLSAVGDRSQVSRRPVTVPVDGDVADGLSTGMLVDVWVAERRTDGERGFEEPTRVAEEVVVGGRATRHGALGSSATTAVQVIVDGAIVPTLIHAVDDEARVTLVPVPGAGAGPGADAGRHS